jgi:hypothetical protein
LRIGVEQAGAAPATAGGRRPSSRCSRRIYSAFEDRIPAARGEEAKRRVLKCT